jgi:hypothetical protein
MAFGARPRKASRCRLEELAQSHEFCCSQVDPTAAASRIATAKALALTASKPAAAPLLDAWPSLEISRDSRRNRPRLHLRHHRQGANLAAIQTEPSESNLNDASAATRILAAIQDALIEVARSEANARVRILPHAQEELIANSLNEAIVNAFALAASHKEPAETAASDASATARVLADIQETPIESCLSKNAERA